ncbi:MAG: 16S rRNA (guanine(966)-N(2))-methyltransferase RsmD [Steroidobacteraceae bacterium]
MGRIVASAHRRGSNSRLLRIIGGEWRGRRLRFPQSEAIRPTPDRVRETLFNWLADRVVGARCLDLFAGSGALGLEALSRGAAHVEFVEQEAAAASALERLLAQWGTGKAAVRRTDALQYLGARRSADVCRSSEEPPGAFDLVFLDPPFGTELAAAAAERLERSGWLAPRALVYLEHPSRGEVPRMPPSWNALRSKRAGEVGYDLFERATDTGSHR